MFGGIQKVSLRSTINHIVCDFNVNQVEKEDDEYSWTEIVQKCMQGRQQHMFGQIPDITMSESPSMLEPPEDLFADSEVGRDATAVNHSGQNFLVDQEVPLVRSPKESLPRSLKAISPRKSNLSASPSPSPSSPAPSSYSSFVASPLHSPNSSPGGSPCPSPPISPVASPAPSSRRSSIRLRSSLTPKPGTALELVSSTPNISIANSSANSTLVNSFGKSRNKSARNSVTHRPTSISEKASATPNTSSAITDYNTTVADSSGKSRTLTRKSNNSVTPKPARSTTIIEKISSTPSPSLSSAKQTLASGASNSSRRNSRSRNSLTTPRTSLIEPEPEPESEAESEPELEHELDLEPEPEFPNIEDDPELPSPDPEPTLVAPKTSSKKVAKKGRPSKQNPNPASSGPITITNGRPQRFLKNKRLQTWRGEHPICKPLPNGCYEVVGTSKPYTPDHLKMKKRIVKKTRKEKKALKMDENLDEADEEMEVDEPTKGLDLSESYIQKSDYTKLKLRNIFIDKETLNWKQSKFDENIQHATLCKAKETNQVVGYYRFHGKCTKPAQKTGNYITIFVLMEGTISIKIGDDSPVLINKLDPVMIPALSTYSIENLLETESFLLFTIV